MKAATAMQQGWALCWWCVLLCFIIVPLKSFSASRWLQWNWWDFRLVWSRLVMNSSSRSVLPDTTRWTPPRTGGKERLAVWSQSEATFTKKLHLNRGSLQMQFQGFLNIYNHDLSNHNEETTKGEYKLHCFIFYCVLSQNDLKASFIYVGFNISVLN